MHDFFVEASRVPFISSRILSSDNWLSGMDTYASKQSGHLALLGLTSHKTRSDASIFSRAKRFSLMARLLSFSYKLARWKKIEKTRARKKLT